MNIRELLGKRIKELRIQKNLKQAELAEIIGIEPRSLSRLESGYHFPKDEHLEKFAKALGVDIRDLFTFSHLNGKYIPEINKLLLDADENQLKMVYKVVLAILR